MSRPASLRVLGIDPGSRVTGFGVVDGTPLVAVHVASGCIRLDERAPAANRLRTLQESLGQIIDRYRPEVVVIEQVFVSKNASSALKLGQARGVLLAGSALANLPVAEYTPADIKRTIAGSGRAEKGQVQHMVKVLLRVQGPLAADAADALAAALCHLRYLGSSARRNRR